MKYQDIVYEDNFKIVLSNSTFLRWLFKGLGLGLSFAYCMFISTLFKFEMDEVALDFCFTTLIALLPALACWQSGDRKTTIQLNQPRGYLTVTKSPWWSILIPAGPYLVQKPTLVPLPKQGIIEADLSGTRKWVIQTGPDKAEIRDMYIKLYSIEIPIVDGKNFIIWRTDDWDTYFEIGFRIKSAINDYYGEITKPTRVNR